MTIRHVNEERSALSYMTPVEINALLEPQLEDVNSFAAVQALFERYGVTTCRETQEGVCAKCTTPAASNTPLSFGWWWMMNTFFFEHLITIAIRDSQQSRIAITTYDTENAGWYLRFDGRPICENEREVPDFEQAEWDDFPIKSNEQGRVG